MPLGVSSAPLACALWTTTLPAASSIFYGCSSSIVLLFVALSFCPSASRENPWKTEQLLQVGALHIVCGDVLAAVDAGLGWFYCRARPIFTSRGSGRGNGAAICFHGERAAVPLVAPREIQVRLGDGVGAGA